MIKKKKKHRMNARDARKHQFSGIIDLGRSTSFMLQVTVKSDDAKGKIWLETSNDKKHFVPINSSITSVTPKFFKAKENPGEWEVHFYDSKMYVRFIRFAWKLTKGRGAIRAQYMLFN